MLPVCLSMPALQPLVRAFSVECTIQYVHGDSLLSPVSGAVFHIIVCIPPVPAPVCSESPSVEDDRLVVSWYYSHTGGLPITSADVFFKPDTSSDPTKAFSDVTGSSLADLSAMNRQDSIPLPEAGLHYEFTVRAGNSDGEAEADCPSLRLDTGELIIFTSSVDIQDMYRVLLFMRLKTLTNPCSLCTNSAQQFHYQ